jgi:hypothetical protein
MRIEQLLKDKKVTAKLKSFKVETKTKQQKAQDLVDKKDQAREFVLGGLKTLKQNLGDLVGMRLDVYHSHEHGGGYRVIPAWSEVEVTIEKDGYNYNNWVFDGNKLSVRVQLLGERGGGRPSMSLLVTYDFVDKTASLHLVKFAMHRKSEASQWLNLENGKVWTKNPFTDQKEEHYYIGEF